MAKIENTTAYPTVLPSASDLLIGTDVDNNNETVTFLVSDIVGAGGVAQDLQSVLDTGNVATQNITLTGNIIVFGTVEPTTITAGGSTGTSGQILSSTGTGLAWIPSPSTSVSSWDASLTVGNTANQKVIVSGNTLEIKDAGGQLQIITPATLLNTGTSTFTGQVNINSTQLSFNTTGQINDSTGSTGTAGQWLTVDAAGTGVEWSSTIPSTSCCNLQDTLAAGATSVGQSVTLSGTSTWTFGSSNNISSAGTNTFSGNNTFSATGTTSSTAAIALSGSLYDGVTTGTAGQILSSTGSGGVSWITSSASAQTLQQVLTAGNSATGANANITLTGFIEPATIQDGSSSSGSAGQYLTSTGTGLSWITPPACCTLDNVLAVGATSTTSITLTGSASLTVPTAIPGVIQDGVASVGTAGQVLTSTGTALAWSSAAGTNTTYDLDVPVGTTDITLTGSDGTSDPVTLSAGTGVTITRNSASQMTIAATGGAAQLSGFIFNERYYINNTVSMTNNIYYTLNSNLDLVAGDGTNAIHNPLPNIPSGTIYSVQDFLAGQIFKNTNTRCQTYLSMATICQIDLAITTSADADINVEFWKITGPKCTPSSMLLISSTNISVSATAINCATVTITGNQNINVGDAVFMTMRRTDTNISWKPKLLMDVNMAFEQNVP